MKAVKEVPATQRRVWLALRVYIEAVVGYVWVMWVQGQKGVLVR